MKTYVFMYDKFAQFEVILTNYLASAAGEVITVGIDDSAVTSIEQFKMIPHKILSEINVDDVDLFVIPGGDPDNINKKQELYDFIRKLNDQEKLIGAICYAPIHLARAGILKGKKFTTSMPVDEYKEFEDAHFVNQNVVVDGNIITGKGVGYIDFAIEIGKLLDIYENEEELMDTINFFKHQKI